MPQTPTPPEDQNRPPPPPAVEMMVNVPLGSDQYARMTVPNARGLHEWLGATLAALDKPPPRKRAKSQRRSAKKPS